MTVQVVFLSPENTTQTQRYKLTSLLFRWRWIDINQCDGEHQFNTFAGTHKCKRETTMCEPLHGHGLRRGGYQCVCKSGFKYTPGRATPYSGGEVESAGAVDYAKADAFQCIPIQGQEVLMSPALSAQTAISSSVNAIPTNAGIESKAPLPPPVRPANFQQPFPTQVPLQADAIPNQPQNFLPFPPEQNTIRPFATFAPILTRPTPPMQSLPPQTSSPFRPNPGFSQPPPVPNAPNFLQGSQPFQQPLPVPQFMPQPINQSSRAGPPQLPNFSPSHGQQFFDPQQFQLRPDNLGPPQQVQESSIDLQRMPPVPQFQAAASRQEMHFAPQFVPPQFDPATQRFNRDIPPRQIRQVPDQDLATSAPPQNAAVIQQLIQKLARENNLMFRARQMLDNLSPRNCSANRFAEKVDLGFSQEFGRKIGKQFATQGRSALRLSHFLSNYLQNGIAVEGKRRNKLTENMILGEMAAMIIAEPAIGAVSVQFEEGVFPGRRFFAPTALYNKMLDELQFYHYPDNYTSFDWYRDIKTKTAATRLADFAVDIKMRVDAAGSRFTDVPTQSFKAITFDDIKSPYGPYYDCFYLDKFFWFEVPFFAKKSEGAIQFGGLISVGINPDQIDVNQCSSAEEPLFRGTDRCDRQSTTCVSFAGRGFRAGGYKCVCKEGFEYPYIDNLQYFDGLAVEIEYQNKLLDFPNNFANLKCRRAGQKLHADTLPVAPLPAQTQRQPVPPSTFAPARTLPTSSTQKVVDPSLAADNSPWIPTIPITMAPTTATTTTTMSPIPPNFHPNQFAPQPNLPTNNFVPSTGFGPQPQRPNSPATNLFQNNFTPANSPRAPVPPRTPNVPLSSTFSAPFQPLPQRPIPPQSFDGSSLIPDQQPSDITNMNAPQFGETEQGTSNNFGGSFVPSFLTETFQTTPSTTSATTTTTTRRPTTTTTTTTPTTTTTTSTTPLTTSTTTTTTTTTTPSSTSDLVVVEIATETPDISAIATTATMEDLDDSVTSSPTDAETTSSTSVITRLVTKHGPTKYTIKVVKGTTSGNLDAEASNEIKRERRIQKKGPNSGNLSSRTSFPLILLSFFSFILLRY